MRANDGVSDYQQVQQEQQQVPDQIQLMTVPNPNLTKSRDNNENATFPHHPILTTDVKISDSNKSVKTKAVQAKNKIVQ